LGEWELETKIKYFVFFDYDAFEIKKGGKRVEFAFKLSLTFDPYFFPLKLYVFVEYAQFVNIFEIQFPWQVVGEVHISHFFFYSKMWDKKEEKKETI